MRSETRDMASPGGAVEPQRTAATLCPPRSSRWAFCCALCGWDRLQRSSDGEPSSFAGPFQRNAHGWPISRDMLAQVPCYGDKHGRFFYRPGSTGPGPCLGRAAATPPNAEPAAVADREPSPPMSRDT